MCKHLFYYPSTLVSVIASVKTPNERSVQCIIISWPVKTHF